MIVGAVLGEHQKVCGLSTLSARGQWGARVGGKKQMSVEVGGGTVHTHTHTYYVSMHFIHNVIFLFVSGRLFALYIRCLESLTLCLVILPQLYKKTS